VTLAVQDKSSVLEIGTELVGWPVAAATPLRRGGNNRLYLLTGNGNAAVLKFYPLQSEDPRDRLGQEFAALSFLNKYGVACVPTPLAYNRGTSVAAYSWIEGVDPNPIGPTDVDTLADFFIALQELRGCSGAAELPPASASCFSPAMVAAQVEDRLARLSAAIISGTDVHDFAIGVLRPAAEMALAKLREGWGDRFDFSALLEPARRALSASDFGFHNALRRADGSLAFLDFEYFGWDDPAKAVADVMLHAGMSLPNDLSLRYRARVEKALAASDPDFHDRLELYLPSMVVLWCLIMLNEFLPERWTRRALAGQRGEQSLIRARQLQKARELLSREIL
jgi:Phosphotransferase enzyme family